MAGKIADLEKRLGALEIQVAQLKARTSKLVEKRRMRLKEKFRIHDHMKNEQARFEKLLHGLLPSHTKDLRECFNNVCKLVDHVLGVEYP